MVDVVSKKADRTIVTIKNDYDFPSVDGENLRYFKEQYNGNRNAQDLTDRLVRENPLQCDWLGITYSQTVHKAVEVRDLVLSRDQGGASHFENLKLQNA